MKQRRVGTFTLGITLVAFGVLFLVHMFVPAVSYYFIYSCWPVIIMLLGVEILYYAVRYKNESFKYDFAAVIIIIMLVIFAMGMAGVDWLYTNCPKNIHWNI